MQAPRWQTTATYHRGLPARERVIGEIGPESIQRASDQEVGRQNKLLSLPLTRIAGRDSPKPLCIADFSARRQGKSLLSTSRQTRTCRPASRGNAWVFACWCPARLCFPPRGDLRSKSARYGGPCPLEPRSPGRAVWPEGFAGLGRPRSRPWPRAARYDVPIVVSIGKCGPLLHG